MKKYFLFFILLILLHLNVSAQFQKKDIKSGISFNLYHQDPATQYILGSSIKQKNSGIDLAVSTGIFISGKLETGIAADYGHSKFYSEFDSSTHNIENRGYGLSLYLNQYFGTDRKVIFFLMYKAGYVTSSNISTHEYPSPTFEYNSDLTTSGISVSLSPGIAIIAFKNLVINTTMGSVYFSKGIIRDNLVSNQTTDIFSYGLDLNPGKIVIGFHYLF
ncbi:MAG TPA: hypothetical protein VI583_13445 [Cyclobacteriaceae bacterium]|nr:hypothetical protein [Cyclobacteriaceae bacterium]